MNQPKDNEVKDIPYADIAKRLSCSPGAARVRVLRGLERLQHEFDSPTNPGPTT